MDDYISKASDEGSTATSSSTTNGEGRITLGFLFTEIKAIRESTTNIEQDTKQIKATVGEIEGKLGALSTRMDEAEERVAVLETNADVTDQQLTTLREELQEMQNHLEDLDNRGRRCKIKILGIPEMQEGNDMITFLQKEIPVMLDHQFTGALEMQRAHRIPTGLPRRSQGQRERPQRVMVNMLRFQEKEEILCAARDKREIKWRGASVMFFPDYSKRTMERRMAFNRVKAELKEMKVEYALRFPATLERRYNGFRHRFSSPEDVSEFIAKKFPKDK